jgi:hypothetical protein
MPTEFTPKPLPYLDRLQKAQRILKMAIHRYDTKIQTRELCEALGEIVTALLDRELRTEPPPTPPEQQSDQAGGEA